MDRQRVVRHCSVNDMSVGRSAGEVGGGGGHGAGAEAGGGPQGVGGDGSRVPCIMG